MPRQRGPVHQLERVPPDLWRRAKSRAALDGLSLRAVMLGLLEEYAAGTLTPKPAYMAPAQSQGRSRDTVTASVEPPPPMPFSSAPDPDLGF